MTVLAAFEMDCGPDGVYWEISDLESPFDAPVATVEAEDFGDYIADLLTSGYVEDILVNTYESWLIEQELLDHENYL